MLYLDMLKPSCWYFVANSVDLAVNLHVGKHFKITWLSSMLLKLLSKFQNLIKFNPIETSSEVLEDGISIGWWFIVSEICKYRMTYIG